LTTRPLLVNFFGRKTPFFDDETLSRQLFEPENAHFWRRDSFSSPLWGKKLTFLATRPLLVNFFGRKTPFFGDETLSRRHFWARNSTFWRRDHFSSTFLGEKLHFLATRLFLVTLLSRKMPIFGDETLSRRHFCMENSTFWRRNSFSSSLLLGKLHFLATKLFLVVILSWETPLFSDETSSRHLFEPENAHFWRRDLFSSSFWGKKLTFLATRPLLVTFFGRKSGFFDEETPRRDAKSCLDKPKTCSYKISHTT
jgi:hypothetical protein